ncbi:MAG: DUF3892 domain-containing protein [Alphaproteobacteria bacterium]
MVDYHITCIRRDSSDFDRRIDAVGVSGHLYPIDQVINWIRTGAHRFWIIAQGKSVWVVVRRHPTSGRDYLATKNDGFPPNNLLSLPEC